jgi:hypothetical protein
VLPVKHLLRPGPMVAMLFGLTWIVLVVWEIAAQPPGGVNTSDPVALQRLFVSTTTGDDYANTFITHLHETSPTGISVSAQGTDIRLTATASRQGPLCVRWPTAKLDGRWLLDPTPSLPTHC